MSYGRCSRCGLLYVLVERGSTCHECGAPVEKVSSREAEERCRTLRVGYKGGVVPPWPVTDGKE